MHEHKRGMAIPHLSFHVAVGKDFILIQTFAIAIGHTDGERRGFCGVPFGTCLHVIVERREGRREEEGTGKRY